MTIDRVFRSVFGVEPAALSSVPGRVNLIGEHIDYNGGTVLPTALTQAVDVAASFRDAPDLRIHSTRFCETVTRAISDTASGHWSDYALGAALEAAKLGWGPAGGELAIDSAVPDGAGVSSSAALATAVLRAAATQAGRDVDPVAIAHHAREVENGFIGMPCGIMDQMAVGLAKPGEALALDTVTLETDVIAIPAGWRFVVIHSGVHRKLSDGRYKRRVEECLEAKIALGVVHICRLDADAMERVRDLPAELHARVRHAVSEHQRVLSAIGAMKADDRTAFGRLMFESHASYSEDFAASVPEIDAMVEAARAEGALGARLTGGGFGGCLVILLRDETDPDWTERFVRRHPGSRVVSG